MAMRVTTAVVAVVIALGIRPTEATLLVPMSDEDLVATSDLVVLGTVAAIESRLLAGPRVVMPGWLRYSGRSIGVTPTTGPSCARAESADAVTGLST